MTLSTETRPLALLPVAGGAVTMVMAEAFTARAPGLGLGCPLPLRGGEPEALCRLALELGLGWQRQLRSFIDQAIVQARDDRSPWFRLPPLLLMGEAGVGRTHAARRIAHAAGVPHVRVDLADLAGFEQLRPRACGPDLVLPSLPVLAIAIGGCANPVVSVEGIEALNPSDQRELASMIDPGSAAQWIDHATGSRVDLRQVSWMLRCDEPALISPMLLDLLQPVAMIWPDEDELPLHMAEVLAEAAIDAGVIDRIQHQASDALTHLKRVCLNRSTAEIYQRARLWLSAHCQ